MLGKIRIVLSLTQFPLYFVIWRNVFLTTGNTLVGVYYLDGNLRTTKNFSLYIIWNSCTRQTQILIGNGKLPEQAFSFINFDETFFFIKPDNFFKNMRKIKCEWFWTKHQKNLFQKFDKLILFLCVVFKDEMRSFTFVWKWYFKL